MMKFLQKLMLICLIGGALQLNAQRYLTEIFDTYQVTEDITIGVNVSPSISDFESDPVAAQADMDFLNGEILAGNTAGIPTNYFFPNTFLPDPNTHTSVKLAPIQLDIYTPPASDTETSRPLFIYLHTGDFLPPLYNQGALGDKGDSAAVNICKQLAMRGYVAASLNYRTGWNPISPDEDVRRETLLRAVYRALHDTQTAVRYMKLSAGDFGVDASKVIVFGQGSGGYVAQAYTTLDEYSEISTLQKFINFSANPIVPYVVEEIDGTIDGGAGSERCVDLLNLAGIPADVHMSVNAGGALADISWLEDGDVPMVAFNCIRDPGAPFDEGTVIVGTTGEDVVDVHGANQFIQAANDFGNNDAFASIPDGDPYTDAARSHYGQTYDYIFASQPTMTVSSTPEGLYPILVPLGASVAQNESNPWDWWDLPTLQGVVAATNAATGTSFDADAIHNGQIASNPGMGPDKGNAYIDTIQGYLHPRVVLALDIVIGIGENPEIQEAMEVFPNPATDIVTVSNEKARIQEVVLTNGMGQIVSKENVFANRHILDVTGYDAGLYILTVIFEEGGQLSRKVILK